MSRWSVCRARRAVVRGWARSMAYEATQTDTKEKPKDSTKDAEILKQALEDYDAAYEFQRGNIDEANEDLKFRRGRQEDHRLCKACGRSRSPGQGATK